MIVSVVQSASTDANTQATVQSPSVYGGTLVKVKFRTWNFQPDVIFFGIYVVKATGTIVPITLQAPSGNAYGSESGVRTQNLVSYSGWGEQEFESGAALDPGDLLSIDLSNTDGISHDWRATWVVKV